MIVSFLAPPAFADCVAMAFREGEAPTKPVYEVISCDPAEKVVEFLRSSDSNWYGTFTYSQGDVVITIRAANDDAQKLMREDIEYWYYPSRCDGVHQGMRIEQPVLTQLCCDLGPVTSLPCGIGGKQLLTLVPSVAARNEPPPPSYDDKMEDRYSRVVSELEGISSEFPTEKRIAVHSPSNRGVAIVDRTHAAVVAPDRSEATVTIRHPYGDPVYLKLTGFRTIEVSWIGERYVRLNTEIGDKVSIDEIYDLVDRSWLVQHAVSSR
jgi:hypothetical protein